MDIVKGFLKKYVFAKISSEGKLLVIDYKTLAAGAYPTSQHGFVGIPDSE